MQYILYEMIFKLNVTLQFIAILLKRKISIVRSDCNSQTAHLIQLLISEYTGFAMF